MAARSSTRRAPEPVGGGASGRPSRDGCAGHKPGRNAAHPGPAGILHDADRSPRPATNKAADRGDREDARFFSRHRHRMFRVRKAFPAEFGADTPEWCIATIAVDGEGQLTTTRLPIRPQGPVPDDERVLRYLWDQAAEHVAENGLVPFNVQLSGEMLDRLTGKRT